MLTQASFYEANLSPEAKAFYAAVKALYGEKSASRFFRGASILQKHRPEIELGAIIDAVCQPTGIDVDIALCDYRDTTFVSYFVPFERRIFQRIVNMAEPLKSGLSIFSLSNLYREKAKKEEKQFQDQLDRLVEDITKADQYQRRSRFKERLMREVEDDLPPNGRDRTILHFAR
jgi:hypothetical protein